MDKTSETPTISKGLSKPFRAPFKPPATISKTTDTPSAGAPKSKLLSLPAAGLKQNPVAEKEEIVNTYFKIFYTKDIKKKTKAFKDGFLELTKGKVRIHDSEGNEVYETSRGRYFKDKPAMDDEYFLSSYMIQIQEQLKPEEFTSGRCFLKNSNQPPIKSNSSLAKSSTLLHKKMKFSPKKDGTGPVAEVQVPEGAYVLVEGSPEKALYTCYIDPVLGMQMRIHQKEGVKFMFECVAGLRGTEINGCILADSMGLGKTLQTIGLIWTLVKQSPYSMKKPLINKVIVLAPLSVVKNWEKEFGKWLGSTRLQPLVAIGEKTDINKAVENFTQGHYRCLLTSYEVFRKQVDKLNGYCDLLILDEGHRMKNQINKTFQCFTQFNCKRRIILTGTPLQNRLEELYACCDFINPGVFPNLNSFRKVFITPIVAGLKNTANREAQSLAKERSKELSTILGSFILRRPASILENILPPKHEYFVLLKLSEAQKAAYKSILRNKIYKSDMAGEGLGEAFTIILVLRKLLNHPQLLATDETDSGRIGMGSFPENVFQMNLWETSMKFRFTQELLTNMKPTDKVIIVSYFTQTLDLVEKLCSASNLKYLRLDGQVAALKRQRLVDRFNDKTSDIRVFLLGGKAGGTGLNLTGANKMIMFEADWNPSNDNQVMGRIWRDGQKKEAKIYRLVSCGTIEEKIIQRQFVKENLSMNVVDEKNMKSLFDTNDLKKIFKFDDDTKSIIFGAEENDKEQLFETNEDFQMTMRNYIMFLKKKTDVVTDAEKANKTTSIKNEFGEESFFLTEEKEEQKDEENGEDGEEGEKGKDDDEDECFYQAPDDDEDDKKSTESDDEEEKQEKLIEEKKVSKPSEKNNKEEDDESEEDEDEEGDEKENSEESEEEEAGMMEEETKANKKIVNEKQRKDSKESSSSDKDDEEEESKSENDDSNDGSNEDEKKSVENNTMQVEVPNQSKPLQSNFLKNLKPIGTITDSNQRVTLNFRSLIQKESPMAKQGTSPENNANGTPERDPAKPSLKNKVPPGEIGQNALKRLKLL